MEGLTKYWNNMELIPSKNEVSGRWSLEGVEPSQVTFAKICHMIREGTNFKFARYGDGEFNAIFGKEGQNCDGHKYFPDMGARLADSFSKKVMTGIQPLALTTKYKEGILNCIEGLELYNSDAIHNASIDLQLSDLLRAIDECKRPHVCVGPAHLVPMFDSMILIPNENCWLTYEDTKSNLSEWINENENGIVLLCASMMSEVLIFDFVDSPVTMIDTGSVFDPYVNVKSRKYHYKLPI